MTLKKPMMFVLPHQDHQGLHCIQVERSAGLVKFIPLDVVLGLEIHSTSVDSFDQRFTPMEGYPVEKACQLFVSYSQSIGATKEAMDYLSRVVSVSKQEFEMATTKKRAAEKPAATKAVKTVEKKAAAKSIETKVGRRAVDPTVRVKPSEKSIEAGAKKTSAAQMFQDLIMSGKLTDGQIFEKVQVAFSLDEKKRSYVKWYRNNLKKQGRNPPEAKVAK